jgi:hypothetical protein
VKKSDLTFSAPFKLQCRRDDFVHGGSLPISFFLLRMRYVTEVLEMWTLLLAAHTRDSIFSPRVSPGGPL